MTLKTVSLTLTFALSAILVALTLNALVVSNLIQNLKFDPLVASSLAALPLLVIGRYLTK